jgi:hypothetical protein
MVEGPAVRRWDKLNLGVINFEFFMAVDSERL